MTEQSLKVQITAIETIGTECEKIIARHDDLLFKIKALSVTLWSVSAGWAVTRNSIDLLVIGLVAILGLWFVAATFRGAQKRYIRRSDAVYLFLTDADRLAEFRSTGHLPSDVPRSLGGYEPRMERAKLLLRGLVSPTVAMFYSLFFVITLALYLVTLRNSAGV